MADGAGSIPAINQDIVRHLQDKSEILLVSAVFSKLPTNEKRVSLVYDLLQENGLLPGLTIDGKNDGKSEEWRKKGNEMFKMRKAREAHEYYTKSLALANPGSENVSLAYANRSAVLFENGLYRECLDDIKMALSFNYPERLKPKLVARLSKAKELEPRQPKVDFVTPVPNISPEDQNQMIQSATNSVRIEHSDTLGRQVVATRDIEPGEIIAVEKPYCHVLSDQFYIHCHHCLKLCYTLLPCANCTQALFCSETCETQAKNYHQFECPILLTIRNMDLEHRHLHLRVTIFARPWYAKLDQCKLKKDEMYRSDRYEEIYNLVANTTGRSVSDLFNRAVHVAALYHLMKTYTSFFRGETAQFEDAFKELLLFHSQAGPCNFHEIAEVKSSDCTPAKEEIGAGAFSFLSMFNHSCCPNVTRYGYGPTTVAMAIERIKAGQQCFDNYGYHHAVMSRADRKAKLKKQYFFDCTCIACVNNYPMYIALKEVKNPEHLLTPGEIKLVESGSLEQVKEIFKILVKKINAVSDLKPNKTLGELQEALKQCCFIFVTIKTPI